MFVHPEPERVAIIGGGEGATLREVLKHNTIEEVVMIEIDERLVEIAKEHLREWNDCSSLVGSTESCFDDRRATLVFTDAIAWFMNHFGNETSSGVKAFDVIIMDALDPHSMVEFSDLLYGNANLIEAFSRALGDRGVFVAQMGEALDLDAAAPHQNTNDPYHRFVEGLARAGFDSIFEYTESHSRFMAPWTFVVALKDSNMRARWFRNEAQLQLDMHGRSLLTDSNELPFRFFDGATFMSYQFPNRIVEETWCRSNEEECEDGHGFDPSLSDRKDSSYKVARSIVANGGRGVFAKEKIAKDSYLGIEACVNGIFVPPSTFEILEDFSIEISYPSRFWATIYEGYIQGYGNDSAGIEVSLLTFVNHGCNNTYNIGHKTDVSELTVDLNTLTNQTFYNDKNAPYHPFTERHFPSWGCPNFKALRDIEEGDEILDNYMVFGGSNGSKLHDYVAELRSMCSGGIGSVTQYELERDQKVVKDQ